MSNLILGVGEFGASKTPGDIVKTFALGSCVAVILMCPKTRTVGMVHVALPESKINPEKVKTRPGYFADTGIPALLKKMSTMGCDPNGRGFIVKLAGGAKIMDPNNTFNIGKRNALSIKKVLWKYGLGSVAEDLGATYSRTVSVAVSTGEITLSSPGRGDWKL
ncbi:MAG: chemotaxis protein CheD [Desulfuromonas sp.]|nr:chemotaxis protein CheD [Desulfuromonas sp.]